MKVTFRTLRRLVATVAAATIIAAAPAALRAELPSVKLKDLTGRTVDSATLSNGGKPFVISFFATWCKPCNRELSAIAEVYEDWQEETGVKVIAISIDEGQKMAAVKPLVDRKGWDYEVLLDPNSDFLHALGIQNIPHMLIFDGNGNMVESRSGYTEGAENHIIETLRRLKSGATPKAKAPRKKK